MAVPGLQNIRARSDAYDDDEIDDAEIQSDQGESDISDEAETMRI